MCTMPRMKALSIKQPWADRILFAGKDVENRTWRLPASIIGQRISVHAGKHPDGEYVGPQERLGAIVGEVTITGCIVAGEGGSDSPWFQGPFGFTLADPMAYEDPLPCRGMLGFFNPIVKD